MGGTQNLPGATLPRKLWAKKSEGYMCTFDGDCQGSLECIHGPGPYLSHCKAPGKPFLPRKLWAKKSEGYMCTFDGDCQGSLECIHGPGPYLSHCKAPGK